MEQAKKYNQYLEEALRFEPEMDDFNRLSLDIFKGDDKVGVIRIFTKSEEMNPNYLPISYIEIEPKYRGKNYFKDMIQYAAKLAKWEYGMDGVSSTLTAHPEAGYRNTTKSWDALVKRDRRAAFDKETNSYFYNA